MRKIDWVTKLASRKFWALLAALVTAVLTAGGAGDNVVLQVTGVVGAFGACVAYMLAEGIADSKREDNGNTKE